MNTGVVISDIETLLNLQSIDVVLSRQTIYNALLDQTYILIRQKKNLQNLFKDSKLVKFIDCVSMIEVDGGECCGLKGRMMRTKEKIDVFNVSSGDGVLYVGGVDDSDGYTRSDGFHQIKVLQHQRYGMLNSYYLYSEGYIYVFGAFPKAVNIGIIKDPTKLIEEVENADGCQSIYDVEFPCPEDLLPYVKQATIQFIMNTSLRIPQDENPNMDSGIRSKDNPTNT